MWRIPPPMIAGSQADISLTISEDTLVGDLYVFLGSPSGKKNVELTVDGADAGQIIVNSSWATGSTFSFITVNGGRILGIGGNGGNGGPDFGTTGDFATGGNSGGDAIYNSGNYLCSLNIDDGFLFGGGGGGGGGSYTYISAGEGGDPGGGGGGGQGFTGGLGGLGGNPFQGFPAPSPGTAGSISAAGVGGQTGVFDDTTWGGDGGGWGLGGRTGRSSQMIQGFGFGAQFKYYGGLGGRAGDAYKSLQSATLSGAKSEATLRSQGRILGEIGPYLKLPSFSFNFWGFDIQPTNDNVGISFLTNGKTQEVNTTHGTTASSIYYAPGGAGANYQVRERGQGGDHDGSAWTASAAAAGTWVDISTLRQWYRNFTGPGNAAGLFEMRRSDIPSVGADDVMDSVYVKVTMESEP